ncbi:class I SAM-dependent methyltransferase [Robertmurraya sp. GLU-23]
MKLERILPFARSLLEKAFILDTVAVDATIGNGHDTYFLAKLASGTGHVYGFDIQDQALQATKERLAKENLSDRVTLIHRGHEEVKDFIPQSAKGKVTAAIFNLGYLPGGDKSIVTKPETTIFAIEQLLDLLAVEGIIVLVIYHGHEEGAIERDKLLQYVKELDQEKAHVLRYQFENQKNNAPFIIAIEKRS